MVNVAVFSLLFLFATAAPFQDKSIIQWLEDDGSFTVLVNLLKATGLDVPLKGTGMSIFLVRRVRSQYTTSILNF